MHSIDSRLASLPLSYLRPQEQYLQLSLRRPLCSLLSHMQMQVQVQPPVRDSSSLLLLLSSAAQLTTTTMPSIRHDGGCRSSSPPPFRDEVVAIAIQQIRFVL